MNASLPRFPLAFVLALATLLSWWYLVFGVQAGISVANQSGEVLPQVRVCLSGSGCVVRERLWPHEVWKVDVPQKTAGQVQLLTLGGQAQGHMTGGGHVQFVVTPGGTLKVQP